MNRFLAMALVSAAIGCSSPGTRDPAPPAAESPKAHPEAAVEKRSLTLEAALALADSHPELAEARARIDASKGRADQAGAWPNPSLVARLESLSTEQEEYLAGVEQALPLGGRLGAARRAESLDGERLEFEFEARRRTIRARVQGAFAAALYADQVFALLKDSAAAAEAALAVASTLEASGEGLAVDVSRARVESARARVERERAASISREARFALEAAIGRPGLVVESLEGSLELAIDLPAVEQLAVELANHPKAKAARAGVQAHEARLELARSRRIPDVNLELLYRRIDQTDEDGFDVGLGVSLPLFNSQGGAVREARSERRAAQAHAEMSAVELARDLRQSHERLARSLASARAIKEGLLGPQDDIARAYEARYAAGDASLADVLPVRRERIHMRLAYLESLRDVLEAWAGLSFFLNK